MKLVRFHNPLQGGGRQPANNLLTIRTGPPVHPLASIAPTSRRSNQGPPAVPALDLCARRLDMKGRLNRITLPARHARIGRANSLARAASAAREFQRRTILSSAAQAPSGQPGPFCLASGLHNLQGKGIARRRLQLPRKAAQARQARG